jgi:hypothetical protein
MYARLVTIGWQIWLLYYVLVTLFREKLFFSALTMLRVIGMNNETSTNMWVEFTSIGKERKKERIAAAAAAVVYAVHQCRTWKACSWN